MERDRGQELTARGLILGTLLTFVFTAANVSLGLKVGLTFATSIPAAVISMAALRAIGGGTIFENNIVQTVASAAGTLAAIGFVLPGLVIMGWWQSFPFWPTFGICATGGLIGVIFSIPLRRALVTGSDLPFPEGVAAAEVLKVGAGTGEDPAEARLGLRALVFGSLLSAGYALLVAVKLFAAEIQGWFRIGPAASGAGVSFSLALIGAGHLVGLSVGVAFLAGIVIAWVFATPLLTALHASGGPASQAAQQVWSGEVKLIGAGVIGAAAIWSLLRLLGPIARGLREAAAASRARAAGNADLPLEERDLPIGWMSGLAAALVVPVVILVIGFVRAGPLSGLAWPLAGGSVVFVLVASLVVAAVCGYMAGLIGASNSPLSGVGILAIVSASLILALGVAPFAPAGSSRHLIALAIFVTGIVFAAATIANDNLQDLKTGQLVGAAPWAQQVALIVGVLAGAAVIPPVLDLLRQANGFGNVGPNPLLAPQATLMTALAQGVVSGDLDWSLIGAGAAIGVLLILLDAGLGRLGWLRVPPLAVGIGIYLPMGMTAPVVVGAVLGHWYEKRRPSEAGKRLGVLAASGLIVGESLFTVANAAVIQATGRSEPLGVLGDAVGAAGPWLGLAGFGLVCVILYRWALRASRG